MRWLHLFPGTKAQGERNVQVLDGDSSTNSGHLFAGGRKLPTYRLHRLLDY